MKKLTNEFFGKVLNEALLEYTKNRFISEDEINELTACFMTVLESKIDEEKLEDSKIVVVFNDL